MTQVSPPPITSILQPKRFDIYVIDTKWNRRLSGVLHKYVALMETYLAESNNCYILDQQQSIEILKVNHEYVGRDPMLIVYDSDAAIEGRKSGSGFRCCLGTLRSAEAAADLLACLLQIILDHNKSARLADAVRREVHKEGIDGAIEIIGESFVTSRHS